MPELTDDYVYRLVRWAMDKIAGLAIILGILTLAGTLLIWMAADVVPLGLIVLGGLLLCGGLIVNSADVPAPPAPTASSPGRPDGPTATWLRDRAGSDADDR